MNKEKQTIAAIKKAVPEIMELKPMCEIITHKNETDIIYEVKEKIPFLICAKTKLEEYVEYNTKFIKIIGRPITLFDIKQCLVYYGYSTKEFIIIAELWETEDNFDAQSNKLKDKLYDYIKNKND